MNEHEREELTLRLESLRTEHRDLDDIIEQLAQRAYQDELQLRRLKKRKLLLKDMIAKIESMLIPDLDA
ncbi:MAG: DUF465 domain-containing protein [Chromatiales bacterium]|jgi:hypothetical protein